MAIRIDDLSSLDPDLVNQERAIITQQLQEAAPSIDVRRGVLHDLLLHFSAILGAKNQTEQDRLRLASSINAILADPTLADEDTVDNVASNYRVTRREGTAAGGAVTMIVDALRDLTVPVGTVFDAQGKSFVTEQVYTARVASESVATDSDKLLIARGDGTYEFQITVAAEEVGEASKLVKDTALVPRILPLGFVLAVATEDFIGGLNEEDNETLINRFAVGLTTKAVASRINMAAELRTHFESVIHDSVIGFGDAELIRGRHSIFPVSMGNRADWYVQTQPLYRTYGATKEATLVELTSDGYGIWQMTFDREEYPGLYQVSVKPSGADEILGEFTVTEIIRDTDLTPLDTNDGMVPDIVDDIESAFSPFQTVIVKFKDSLTTTSSLTPSVSKADYSISVTAMPLIAEIQAYALERSVRNTAGDVLVKAPVPCFLSVSFTVQLMPGQATPSADNIADDLAALVNNYGFLGRLPASAIIDTVHNHLEGDASIVDVDMVARLYYPDGETFVFRDSELLEIPYEPERLVTARTTLFFLDPADVSITFETADVLQVI